MRQRIRLAPGVLAFAALAVTACANKRQATQYTPPTATATGSSTGTATGYGDGQYQQGQNGDAGNGVQNGNQTPAPTPGPTPTPTPTNTPDSGGFPDPTPPANPGNGTTPPPNNWTGLTDDVPTTVTWAITSLNPLTKVASDGTVTTPDGAGNATIPNTGTGGATVGYEGRVAQILNANCVTGCHVQGGTQPTTPLDRFPSQALADRIVIRADNGGMPPAGNPKLDQADVDVLKAWKAGGFPEKAAAAGTGGTVPAGNGPLELVITDQVYEQRYLNATKLVGKVRGQLKVTNQRQTGFTIHTDGAPFGHGSEIPPGGSVTYDLQSPYNGTSGVYEHGVPGGESNRLIQIEVTP